MYKFAQQNNNVTMIKQSEEPCSPLIFNGQCRQVRYTALATLLCLRQWNCHDGNYRYHKYDCQWLFRQTTRLPDCISLE